MLDLGQNQRFALPDPKEDNVPLKEIDVPNAFLVLALLLFTPHVVFAAPPDTLREDWENHFSQQQAKGTLVVHDLRQPEAPRLVFNPPRARERFSPASTFKIPHTLIALAHEAIKDEFTQLRWDGINRGSAPWNRDQDLRSAMRHSVVWSYQLLARRIGETAERAEIVRLDYGNRTIGPKVDDFWLDGSLRISAHEQIDFLSRLYRNQLPYTLADQRLVKDLMIVEAGRDYIVRAKTGWFNRHGESIGWWVGWVELPDGPVFFALNIDMPGGVGDAAKREAIVRTVLRELGALPARSPSGPP